MTRKERILKVVKYFQEHQPVAETELKYGSPYELLVAVILSAQCTDKRVNMITPAFFSRFPDIWSLAKAGEEEIFPLIRSCSYPNNKSRHLAGMARFVIEKYKGEIPPEVEKLQEIPGVGRKTANVIAAVIFHQPVMTVDTHVFRVSARLGLTLNARTPLETEKQLTQYIPAHLIPVAHHWLILHGRYTCMARNPQCEQCGLKELCRYFESSGSQTGSKTGKQKKNSTGKR